MATLKYPTSGTDPSVYSLPNCTQREQFGGNNANVIHVTVIARREVKAANFHLLTSQRTPRLAVICLGPNVDGVVIVDVIIEFLGGSIFLQFFFSSTLYSE